MPHRMVPSTGTKTDDYKDFQFFLFTSLKIHTSIKKRKKQKTSLRQGLAIWSPKQMSQNSCDLTGSKTIFGAVSMAVTARSKTQIQIVSFFLKRYALCWPCPAGALGPWGPQPPIGLAASTPRPLMDFRSVHLTMSGGQPWKPFLS